MPRCTGTQVHRYTGTQVHRYTPDATPLKRRQRSIAPGRAATPAAIAVRRSAQKGHPGREAPRMGWVRGLEPPTSGTTIQRSNQLSYTHRSSRRAEDREVEPRCQAWAADSQKSRARARPRSPLRSALGPASNLPDTNPSASAPDLTHPANARPVPVRCPGPPAPGSTGAEPLAGLPRRAQGPPSRRSTSRPVPRSTSAAESSSSRAPARSSSNCPDLASVVPLLATGPHHPQPPSPGDDPRGPRAAVRRRARHPAMFLVAC